MFPICVFKEKSLLIVIPKIFIEETVAMPAVGRMVSIKVVSRLFLINIISLDFWVLSFKLLFAAKSWIFLSSELRVFS